MKSLAEVACAHLGAPGIAEPFLARALAGIARIEALADEIRAERHRQDAVLAQLHTHEARLRNVVEALEGLLDARVAGGQPETRKCQCAPGGLSVVLCGGFCAKCGGTA